MRLTRTAAAFGLLSVGLVLSLTTTGGAQGTTCTGNRVIDHAPYTCADSKVINGVTFDITLSVDVAGRAVVDYRMSPVQTTDVPIAVHSYTRIDQDPRQFINGVIPAGQTTAQLVVPRIECGQLDIKAVFVTPGDTQGNIAGPQVTWGDVCQQVPTTTTTSAPTSVAPTSVGPTISPTSVGPTVSPTSAGQATTMPGTGGGGGAPWPLGLLVLSVGAALVVLPRWWDTQHGG